MKKNKIRNEIKQLRQSRPGVDRERIVELDKKIESKAEVWERKIEEIKNDWKFEELEKKSTN